MWGLRVVFVSLDAERISSVCVQGSASVDEDDDPPSTQRAVWTKEIHVEAPALGLGEYCVFELSAFGRLMRTTAVDSLPELGIDVRTGSTTVAISRHVGGFQVHGTDERAATGECEIFEFRPWRLVVRTKQPTSRTIREERPRMDRAV